MNFETAIGLIKRYFYSVNIRQDCATVPQCKRAFLSNDPPISGEDSVFEVSQVSPDYPFYENIIKMHMCVQLWWNGNEKKSKYSEKPCPRTTLSTINLTWTGPGRHPRPHEVQMAIAILI